MFQEKRDEPIAQVERQGVPDRRRAVAPGQKLILCATSLVAALLILFGIVSRNSFFGLWGAPAPAKAAAPAEPHPLVAPAVKVPLALGQASTAPPAPSFVSCPGGLRLPVGMDCPRPEPEPAGASAGGQAQGMSEEERVRERRRRSEIDLGSRGAANATRPAPAQGTAAERLDSAAARGNGHNPLAGALSPTFTPAVRAGLHRNPSMLLAKGSLPDCTLLTAILTDQPGFLKCILSAPVMSIDGKVVLMEAGTTMEGEYTQGLQAGQTAIFTLWSRAVTPNFVTVQLDSPGTDALGRAGTPGQVDSKWFERFAGAVFFSLLEDTKQVYVAREDARSARRAEGGGDTYNIGAQGTLSRLGRTGDTTQAVVEEMLKQGSRLAPSLSKNQGDIIKIFVARDVDFSPVYELRPAASPRAAD